MYLAKVNCNGSSERTEEEGQLTVTDLQVRVETLQVRVVLRFGAWKSLCQLCAHVEFKLVPRVRTFTDWPVPRLQLATHVF